MSALPGASGDPDGATNGPRGASTDFKVAALCATGRWLRETGYHFITPTPATHARVLQRHPDGAAPDLRGIFGWSRPFLPAQLPAEVFAQLREAGLVHAAGTHWHSRVRYSNLDGLLLAHSAYPTVEADSVFFGPDTYRFAAFVAAELERRRPPRGARILDMGCGSGAGGLLAAQLAADCAPALVLADINASALQFTRANAELAGVADAQFAQGDLYACVEVEFDLILANPPYLNDGAERVYRHGGGAWGGALSERIVQEGLPRLRPGGRLLLYTGAAIVDGRDPLHDALQVALQQRGWPWTWRELDPDVFGEELEQPAYATVDRIAAVGLLVERPVR